MSVLRIDDTMLMAFADEQLDPASAAQIRDAVAGSAELRARVAMFRETARAVRALHAEPQAFELPPRLRRATRAAILRSQARQIGRIALPIAAAVGGLMLGAYVTLSLTASSDPQSVDYVLGEVAEYHAVYAGESDHLVEVPATRTAEIESWLGHRVGLDLHVPDLAAKGLTFKGARLLVVDGKPVAQLMYATAADRHIALCVGASTLPAGATGRVDRDGTIVAGTTAGQHMFIAAGPAADAALVDGLVPSLPALLTAV